MRNAALPMDEDGTYETVSPIAANRCLSQSLHCSCCSLVSVLGPECTQLVNEELSEALRPCSFLELSRLALMEAISLETRWTDGTLVCTLRTDPVLSSVYVDPAVSASAADVPKP